MLIRKKYPSFLLPVLLLSVCRVAAAQSLPDKSSVLHKMVLANGYFMTSYPDPSLPIVTNRSRPSNIWTRAVYYEGLTALYGIAPRASYLHYTLRWARSHHWDLPGGDSTRIADNQACGQTYIALYMLDRKPDRIEKIKASIDAMIASDKIDDWWWIDAIQMAMPDFAGLGVIFHDTKYFKRMYEMYSYTKKRLYNPRAGLWWRDSTFLPPYKEPNGRSCYWSRGNGWVVAGLVRVLSRIPPSAAGYRDYKRTYLAMMKAVLPLQRKDGFWNVSLHDPDHFGGRESTGTSLLLYGMAWGVRKGWLDRKTYMPAIVKAWDGLANVALHPDGMLGYVQGSGAKPGDGQPVGYNQVPDFQDFGVGCFLLAGSEVYRLTPR